jgi:hypothetical protein
MRDGRHAIRITDRLPALLAINVPILTPNQARRHLLAVYTKWYIRLACAKR